jgi:hypothetical protein
MGEIYHWDGSAQDWRRGRREKLIWLHFRFGIFFREPVGDLRVISLRKKRDILVMKRSYKVHPTTSPPDGGSMTLGHTSL